MTESKKFPTCDVISALTGVLISDIDGVYKVLDFMAGESLFTHQLSRVSSEADKFMSSRWPEFQQIKKEAQLVTTENVDKWATVWLDRYGSEIEVYKMTNKDHKPINPIVELYNELEAK